MSDSSKKSLVVIVDDELDLLTIYKNSIESIAEVVCFLTANEFISYIQEHKDFKPDLVITDYSMPGLSGVDMVKKAVSLGFEMPAVVLISGNLNKEKAIAANNVQVSRIIEKPFESDYLVEVASEALIQQNFKNVRKEMAQVMDLMREVFSVFRIVCQDQIDESVKNKNLVDANSALSPVLTLEEHMNELDERLNRLQNTEEILLKSLNQHKKAA